MPGDLGQERVLAQPLVRVLPPRRHAPRRLSCVDLSGEAPRAARGRGRARSGRLLARRQLHRGPPGALDPARGEGVADPRRAVGTRAHLRLVQAPGSRALAGSGRGCRGSWPAGPPTQRAGRTARSRRARWPPRRPAAGRPPGLASRLLPARSRPCVACRKGIAPRLVRGSPRRRNAAPEIDRVAWAGVGRLLCAQSYVHIAVAVPSATGATGERRWRWPLPPPAAQRPRPSRYQSMPGPPSTVSPQLRRPTLRARPARTNRVPPLRP